MIRYRIRCTDGVDAIVDPHSLLSAKFLPPDASRGAQRNGDSDYTATCRDGNRYHVYVDPTGRVVVKKL